MATHARPAARLMGAGLAAALLAAVTACGPGTDPDPTAEPGTTPSSPSASPSPSSESPSAEPTESADPSESAGSGEPSPPPENPAPAEWVITPEAFGPIELGSELETVVEHLGGTISNPSADHNGAECRVATDFGIEDLPGDLQVTAVDGVVVAVKWGVNQGTSIEEGMELPTTEAGVTLASPDADVSEAMGPEALINGWGPSSGVAWSERAGDNMLVAESTTLSPAEQPSNGFIGWLYVFNDDDGDTFPDCFGN